MTMMAHSFRPLDPPSEPAMGWKLDGRAVADESRVTVVTLRPADVKAACNAKVWV